LMDDGIITTLPRTNENNKYMYQLIFSRHWSTLISES
jgi:hypothetical protein